MTTHYVINRVTGARQCQDGKWREFAGFGTYPECVKVWRQKGWAVRRMQKLNWRTGDDAERNVATVLSLPADKVMDAAGNILDAEHE
jgi:hypothetical protein